MICKIVFLSFLCSSLINQANVVPVDAPKPRYRASEVKISTATRLIMKDLAKCESGGNPNAINPNDLDNTPSYGKYQFKPSTLYAWNKQYKIMPDIEKAEIMNVIFDGEFQDRVVERAIEDNKGNVAWWSSQFPACSKRYNYWK